MGGKGVKEAERRGAPRHTLTTAVTSCPYSWALAGVSHSPCNN